MKREEDAEVAAEIRRIAAALKTAIRLSGVSHRHIERQLHMSTGYLTRILGGDVELRVRHVLGMCRVIGLPVGNFFSALFPSGAPQTIEEARLLRGLVSLEGAEPPKYPRDPEALLAELRGYLGQLRDVLESEG